MVDACYASEAPDELTPAQRRAIWIGSLAALICIPFLILAFTIPGKIRALRQEQATEDTQIRVDELIRNAQSEARAYRFRPAAKVLDDAGHHVSKADLTDDDARGLASQIESQRQGLARAEAEYQRKLRAGYQLENGLLLSPDEQKERAAAAETAQREQLAHAQAAAAATEVRALVSRAVLDYAESRRITAKESRHSVEVGTVEPADEYVIVRGTLSYHYSMTKEVPLAGLLGDRAREEGRLNDRAAEKAANDANLLEKDGYSLSPDRTSMQKDSSSWSERTFICRVRTQPSLLIEEINFDPQYGVKAPLSAETRSQVIQAIEIILTSLKNGDATWATRVVFRLPNSEFPVDLRPESWRVLNVFRSGYGVSNEIEAFVRIDRSDQASPIVLNFLFEASSDGIQLYNRWWCTDSTVKFPRINVQTYAAKENARTNELAWDQHERSLSDSVAAIRAMIDGVREGVNKADLQALTRRLSTASRSIEVVSGDTKMQRNADAVATILNQFRSAEEAFKDHRLKLRLATLRQDDPVEQLVIRAVAMASEFVNAFDALALAGNQTSNAVAPAIGPARWREHEVAALQEQNQADLAVEKKWSRERVRARPGERLALDERIKASSEGRKRLVDRVHELKAMDDATLASTYEIKLASDRRMAAARKRLNYFREMTSCACIVAKLAIENSGLCSPSLVRFLGPFEKPDARCDQCGGTGFQPAESP